MWRLNLNILGLGSVVDFCQHANGNFEFYEGQREGGMYLVHLSNNYFFKTEPELFL
jgi:hypothetical protein